MSRRRAAARRAPRLGPDDLIATHFTRVGRFRKVDPTKPKTLPSFSRILGAVGWAVLMEESVRRARKAAKADAGAVDVVTGLPVSSPQE